MPWVVVHGGTGGNKQSNSLSSTLEDAFLSHWLFKCTRSVCVCTYTFYMSLSLRVDSAHSQQSAAANDSLCCVSDTSQLIRDSSPVSTHTWWRVHEAAGYKKSHFIKLKYKYAFVWWSQHIPGCWQLERPSAVEGRRNGAPLTCLRDSTLYLSPPWCVARCWLQVM